MYRVAELSEGWQGHLIETQKYFIGLEGAIVSAAVLSLNAFHPGICLREGDQAVRNAFRFGKKKGARQTDSELASEKTRSDNDIPAMEQTRNI